MKRQILPPKPCDALFLKRCEQLSILSASDDLFDNLDISAKLRALFLDQHALIDCANRGRMKVYFKVGNLPSFTRPGPGTFAALDSGLDPEGWSAGAIPVSRLDRNQLMAHPVITLDGKFITVKDVIKYGANALGGVHHDPNPKQEYRLSHELAQSRQIGGRPVGLGILRPLGRVVVKGLTPLIENVRERFSLSSE